MTQVIAVQGHGAKKLARAAANAQSIQVNANPAETISVPTICAIKVVPSAGQVPICANDNETLTAVRQVRYVHTKCGLPVAARLEQQPKVSS